MNLHGIEFNIKNVPELDPAFIPILKFNRAFLETAKKPVSIAVERADGQIATTHTFIHGTPEMAATDRYYIDRLVKTELWMKGGFKVYVNDKLIVPTDVNGKTVDVLLYKGTTYLPVRAVANALDQAVAWDGASYSVYIGSHKDI